MHLHWRPDKTTHKYSREIVRLLTNVYNGFSYMLVPLVRTWDHYRDINYELLVVVMGYIIRLFAFFIAQDCKWKYNMGAFIVIEFVNMLKSHYTIINWHRTSRLITKKTNKMSFRYSHNRLEFMRIVLE